MWIRAIRRSRSLRLLLLVAAFTLPLVACSAPIIIATKINDSMLSRFERLSYEYPLPSSFQVVSRDSEFGLLEGNGNHCDVRVTQVLQTPLPVPEIERHYRSAGLLESLRAIRGGRWVSVEVRPVDNPQKGGASQVAVELFSPGDVFQDMEVFDIRCR